MSRDYGSDVHLVPLPGTGWKVWRQAVLRTTGFPVDGLDRLSPPDCAAAADAYLDGPADSPDRGEFDKHYDEAVGRTARELHRLAADPLLREAVTWQSRSVLSALDGIAAAGPEPSRTRKHRQRERILARYWQRYCAKTETIGFFGPVCWVTLDPSAPAVTALPGRGLVRRRMVFLEDWALAAYADRLREDPAVRRWLSPALPAHLALDGDLLLDPNRPPVKLFPAEAAVLEHCDGRHSAVEIARAAAADPGSGVRTEDDACLLLDQLAERRLLRWNIDLPVSLECEAALRSALGAIGDASLREDALAGLDRLGAARDAVAAAAGDPDALAAALGALDAEFAAVSGREPTRRPGEMYAGRGLCWEETARDLEVVLGGAVLEALAAPLSVLLQAARWVTAELAEVYGRALRDLYDELAADLGRAEVPLGQLWYLAQGLFYGTGPRPVDAVTAEFSRRWARLFGVAQTSGDGNLPGEPAEAPDIVVAGADLAPALERLFPARPPGWSDARLHSPDIQLCARSAEELREGRFTAVLGEMHVAWATNACGVFVSAHQDPQSLRDAHAADVGTGRLRPLLPADWPRYTARLAFALADRDDVMLAFAPAPGAEPGRVLPVSALHVVPRDGHLAAVAPDGRAWPLAEVFTRQLSELAVDAFKLAGTGAYSPRVTLDRMVIARRTWRTTVGRCALSTVIGDRGRYLAARAWRRQHGLPERVFVKIGSETKPTFVDLSSPLYVDTFATMLRSARQSHGPGVPVSVSEMLPSAEEAWVPDAAGRRYVSELRLQIRDPLPAATHGGSKSPHGTGAAP